MNKISIFLKSLFFFLTSISAYSQSDSISLKGMYQFDDLYSAIDPDDFSQVYYINEVNRLNDIGFNGKSFNFDDEGNLKIFEFNSSGKYFLITTYYKNTKNIYSVHNKKELWYKEYYYNGNLKTEATLYDYGQIKSKISYTKSGKIKKDD